MIRKILIASLTVIVNGMVDAVDVCLPKGDFTLQCKKPPAFKVQRPTFCDQPPPTPPPSPSSPSRRVRCNTDLTIAGCSIAIVCLVVTLVICIMCIANKTRPKPQLLSFMNVCIAQLGLFVFFLVDVTVENNIAISFFVDVFLFTSVSCVLFEAVAICISVDDKTVPREGTIAGVSCCWGLPLLKSIITVAVNSSLYSYSSGEYFLGTGRPLNTAIIIIITLLFCAIAVALVYSAISLCLEKEQRHEVWLRTGHTSAIFLCSFSWIVTLLVVGAFGQPFCTVFIVFAMAQGIIILVGFCYRHFQMKEFCESSCGSPSVSPSQNGEEKEENARTIQLKPTDAAGQANKDMAGQPN